MRQAMIIIGAVLVSVSLAAGQHSGVGSGNALDANPGLGSARVNAEVPQQTPINTNLFVYGQSTGLSGFHGSSFYAPNQLRLDLPGQSVRNFSAQSVGLQEVQSGYGLYQPTAYLDRAQTVVGLRAIELGLNSPGSNVPGQSVMSPQIAQDIYTQAVQRYDPITVERPAGQLLSDNPTQGPITQTVRLAQIQGPDDVFLMPAYLSPDQEIFEAPYQEGHRELMAEVRNMRTDFGTEFGPSEEEVDPRIDPMDGQFAEPGDVEQAGMQSTPIERTRAIPQPGRDVYYDLVMTMRLEHPEQADILLAEYEASFRENRELSTVTFDEATSQYVLHSLAGLAVDEVNTLLASGQAELKEGKFYDANADFIIAGTNSAVNPCPHLGSAVAMFAAGEPVTAAHRLKLAMNMFPPTIETRVDLPALLGEEVAGAALADLDEIIGHDPEDDDAMLLLLAVYMHSSANDIDRARLYAQRLLDVAGEDKVLSTYGQFIITGEPVEGLFKEAMENARE